MMFWSEKLRVVLLLPENGTITVKAWGRSPKEVLQPIRRLLQDHRMAQEPETQPPVFLEGVPR